MMRKPVLAVLIAALMAVPAVAFTQTTATKSMATPAATTTTKTSSAMIGTMINVNTASAAELMKIPGVSTTVAAEIIKNRPFRNAAELVEKVKGIGKKMIMVLSF